MPKSYISEFSKSQSSQEDPNVAGDTQSKQCQSPKHTKKHWLPLIILAIVGIVILAVPLKTGNSKNDAAAVTDSVQELSLEECTTQSEINTYFSKQDQQHQDSVLKAFEQYLQDCGTPSLFEQERTLFESYQKAADEAYASINLDEYSGSGATVGFYEFDYDLWEQFLVSFSKQGTKHKQVTDAMVENEYDRFLNHGIASFTYCPDATQADSLLKGKKESLLAEKRAWIQWMKLRNTIGTSLSGAAKNDYENQTNELRRMKLIQLKNQYQSYGMGSDEFFENQLSPDCSDAELAQYTCFDLVWKAYSNQIHRQ